MIDIWLTWDWQAEHITVPHLLDSGSFTKVILPLPPSDHLTPLNVKAEDSSTIQSYSLYTEALCSLNYQPFLYSHYVSIILWFCFFHYFQPPWIKMSLQKENKYPLLLPIWVNSGKSKILLIFKFQYRSQKQQQLTLVTCMPGQSVSNLEFKWNPSNLTITIYGRYYHYPHFMQENNRHNWARYLAQSH